MTTGTPGFIGERLKQAREARGLTAVALAEILGITRQAISRYEIGLVSPQPEIMSKIAEKLNIPASYFFRPSEPLQDEAIFYRSMSNATKTARTSAERRYNWLNEQIMSFLREYVNLPTANVPVMPLSKEPQALTQEDIESIAIYVRKFWNLGNGPISNVTLLLENNGVIVAPIELGVATLDAYSVWAKNDNTPYIIVNTEKDTAARWRFNVAHELGHLVMHKKVNKKKLNSANDFKLLEQQAHKFAAAFLLPCDTYSKDLYNPKLDNMLSLKRKWVVSIAMQITRAQDLGIIDEEYARRLWINFNRRGWKRTEPLDQDIPHEQPRLLKRAFELIIENESFRPEQISDMIGLAASDIERLANLRYGYLTERANLITMKDGLSKDSTKSDILDEADEILEQYQ